MPLEPTDAYIDAPQRVYPAPSPATPEFIIHPSTQEFFTHPLLSGLVMGGVLTVVTGLSLIGVLWLMHWWKSIKPGGADKPPVPETLPAVAETVNEPLLQQVSLTVWAASSMLTRDVVRCLEQLAGAVKTHPFPQASLDGQIMQASRGELQYALSLKPCTDPNECFVASFSSLQPIQLHAATFPLPHSSPGRYFILKSQGMGLTRTGVLAACIQAASKRIAEGEVNGSDYGYEAGYAFQVVPAPYES